MNPLFEGAALGVISTVMLLLYKSVIARIIALEGRATAFDERHNETDVEMAQTRTFHSSLKETVDKLSTAVEKLADVVTSLKVAVGK